MCDLCGEEAEKQKARERYIAQADRLMQLARCLRNLGEGKSKPHSDATKQIERMATRAIRDLAIDWL